MVLLNLKMFSLVVLFACWTWLNVQDLRKISVQCRSCRRYFFDSPLRQYGMSKHAFQQHEKSVRRQRLHKKLYKSENELNKALQRAELSLVEKAKVNIHITKCVYDFLLQTLHKKWSFTLKTADLVTFTEDILNGKLLFCGEGVTRTYHWAILEYMSEKCNINK